MTKSPVKKRKLDMSEGAGYQLLTKVVIEWLRVMSITRRSELGSVSRIGTLESLREYEHS